MKIKLLSAYCAFEQCGCSWSAKEHMAAVLEKALKVDPWFEVKEGRYYEHKYRIDIPDRETGNLIEDFVVHDSCVEEVVDDVREGVAYCNFCGHRFDPRDPDAWEKHCREMEALQCPEGGPYHQCFYRTKTIEEKQHTSGEPAGDALQQQTFTDVEITKYRYVCGYGKYDAGKHLTCVEQEHRRLGYTSFTPKNTMFLALRKRPELVPVPADYCKIGRYWFDTHHSYTLN